MTSIASKKAYPQSHPGKVAPAKPSETPAKKDPADPSSGFFPALTKVFPALSVVPLIVRLVGELPVADKPEEVNSDDPQKFYNTESKALDQLENELLKTVPENSETALAKLHQTEALAQQYLQLSTQEGGDQSKQLAERTYELLEKVAGNWPYPEIQKRAKLYAAYHQLAAHDFDGAKEAFKALKGDFDEAFDIMKRMKSDELRGRNLRALDVWEVSLEDGKTVAIDQAHGILGIGSGMITKLVDDKTSDDYVYERYQIEKDLISTIRDQIKSGKEKSIDDALMDIDDPRLKPRAKQLLAERNGASDDGSYLIAHLIRYVSENDLDAEKARELFRDADQTEARSWVKSAYCFYSFLKETAPDEDLQKSCGEKIAKLENGKNLGDRLWDMIRTTTADDIAWDILVMKGCQTLGALAKVATLSKLAQAGITGYKATALAFSAEVLAEGGAFGTSQLAREAANHDVEQVFTPEHILKVYAANLIMVGGLKKFSELGLNYAPRAARALEMVKADGTLSKGGEILVGALNHTAALSGMVTTTQVNQALGLVGTPEGGFLESLAHDVFSYAKYGFAQKGLDKLMGPEIEQRSRELQEKILTLHTALLVEGHMKNLGYEAVLRTEEGVPVFKDVQTQKLYIQLIRESLTKPGFEAGKLSNLLREKKTVEAQTYLKGFGLTFEDFDLNADQLKTIQASSERQELRFTLSLLGNPLLEHLWMMLGAGGLGGSDIEASENPQLNTEPAKELASGADEKKDGNSLGLFGLGLGLTALFVDHSAEASQGPAGLGPTETGMILAIGSLIGLGFVGKKIISAVKERFKTRAEAKGQAKEKAAEPKEEKQDSSAKGAAKVLTFLGLGLGLGALLGTEQAQAATEALTSPAGDSFTHFVLSIGFGLGFLGLAKYRPRELADLNPNFDEGSNRPNGTLHPREVETTLRHYNGVPRAVDLDEERRLGTDILPAGTRLFYSENGRLFAIRATQPSRIRGVNYETGDRVYFDADARPEFAVLHESRQIQGIDCAAEFPVFFDSQGKISRVKLASKQGRLEGSFAEGEVVDIQNGILVKEESVLKQWLWTAAAGVGLISNGALLATADFSNTFSGLLGTVNLVATLGSLFFFTRDLRWTKESVPRLPDDAIPLRVRIAQPQTRISIPDVSGLDPEMQADLESVADEETTLPPKRQSSLLPLSSEEKIASQTDRKSKPSLEKKDSGLGAAAPLLGLLGFGTALGALLSPESAQAAILSGQGPDAQGGFIPFLFSLGLGLGVLGMAKFSLGKEGGFNFQSECLKSKLELETVVADLGKNPHPTAELILRLEKAITHSQKYARQSEPLLALVMDADQQLQAALQKISLEEVVKLRESNEPESTMLLIEIHDEHPDPKIRESARLLSQQDEAELKQSFEEDDQIYDKLEERGTSWVLPSIQEAIQSGEIEKAKNLTMKAFVFATKHSSWNPELANEILNIPHALLRYLVYEFIQLTSSHNKACQAILKSIPSHEKRLLGGDLVSEDPLRREYAEKIVEFLSDLSKRQ